MMRRWNGWGDENVDYHLPASANQFLSKIIGQGKLIPDATFESLLASVPPTRLKPQTWISTDPFDRLLHTRGQSLPDWVALRYGRIPIFPDGVTYPQNDSDVRQILEYAASNATILIPYGGGTSVVGHINPIKDDRPTLTVDLRDMNQLIDFDQTSHLATMGAGVNGPELEKLLKRHGYTLGHFPQSFELSTLGGWIATRSSGQQSYYYGRIEDLFAGGHVETITGPLDLPVLPASAAGPDLRQIILGSEGRLGIITRATMRVQPSPQHESFHAIFFPDWESGMSAVRAIAQQQAGISMARLSDAQETETTLALAGKDRLIAWADRGLRLLGQRDVRCLLIYGLTGEKTITKTAQHQVRRTADRYGGLYTGTIIGSIWRKSRFLTPYLRNTLWERGYALDTLETAVPWSKVPIMADALKDALRRRSEAGSERLLVFAHLSHVYKDGASIYVTYLFKRFGDPDHTLEHWHALKSVASQVIVSHSGTISHQHGVGMDHAPYLQAEKGILGNSLLKSMTQMLDPDNILNPGKLLV